jgi:hypothetical protein
MDEGETVGGEPDEHEPPMPLPEGLARAYTRVDATVGEELFDEHCRALIDFWDAFEELGVDELRAIDVPDWDLDPGASYDLLTTLLRAREEHQRLWERR